ncbi:hypothetical protein ACFIJ5_04060 [Haloimpatiens sp. FM7330]|uniref:hypothetical protein n=1 Tax=Haloimpatiens sp. FM7330 TaxID=3298610 RepID=UPI00362F5BDE
MQVTKSKWIEKIEDIISSRRWVKNNISMGRIQCSKLLKEKDKLNLVIVSDSLDKPLYAMVQKIIINNGEIIMCFDGEYPLNINKDQYDEFKDYFTVDEWDNIFNNKNITEYLIKDNLINNKEGYLFVVHQNAELYIKDGFDKEATEELCCHYSL